jgi:hypothetical protein
MSLAPHIAEPRLMPAGAPAPKALAIPGARPDTPHIMTRELRENPDPAVIDRLRVSVEFIVEEE